MLIAGQFLALGAAACWAHNSVVYARAGVRVGSGAVAHIRLWIALPIMFVVHLAFLGRLLPVGEIKSIAILAVSGFLGFFVADVFLFRGFVEIGSRETLVILTLSPIAAATISWFVLGEKLSSLQISGIAITIAGVSWLIAAEQRDSQDRRRSARGFVWALLGSGTQALGMVLAKQGLSETFHPISANVVRMSAGLIGLVAYRMVGGNFFKDFASMKDRRALLLIGEGATVGPVAGIIMNLYALSLAPVGVVTTLMGTSPILLLPVEKFLMRRKIPISAYIATIVAVSGTVLLFIR